MKKTLMVLALIAMAAGAMAQTDFRHITFDEAKAAAKAENKKIFVDFYTQWCGPCKMLAKKVFPTKEVGDFLNAGFVCLKLDAENEGKDLAKSVKVDAYPTLAVFDADGNMTGSFAGYKEGTDFIDAVKAVADPNLKPEVVERKYLGGDRTPDVVKAYVRNIYESGRSWTQRRANVEPIISDYFDSLSDADRLNPENAFIFSLYTYDYDSPRAQFLVVNRDMFDSSVKEETTQALERIMMSKALDYLSTNNLSDSSEYDGFKAFVNCLKETGLHDRCGAYIAFAEKRRVTDDDGYLDYCDKNLGSLDDTGVYYFIESLPQLVGSETKEQKSKISKFLRGHLADMHASNISTAGSILYRLEGDDK